MLNLARLPLHVYLAMLLWAFVLPLSAQSDSLLGQLDIPPLFKGCDDPLISAQQRQNCSNPKIQAFINATIKYPDSARVKGIEGVVVVRFTVDTNGHVRAAELLRNIGSGCGKEALRVVNSMPPFTPALRNGFPVATSITLPIRFKKIKEASSNNKNLYQLHWGNVYGSDIESDYLKQLLPLPLSVRDYYGNIYPVSYFEIQHRMHKKVTVLEQKGARLNNKMKRLLKNLKKQQKFTIKAFIIKDIETIRVERVFVIAGVS